MLYNRQHGFRKGLDCETQLYATYHDIEKSVEHGHVIHGVVLNFRKAFDKVPTPYSCKKSVVLMALTQA